MNSSQIRGKKKSLLKHHLTLRMDSTMKLCMLLFAAGEEIDFHQSECFKDVSVRNYKYIKGLTKYELWLKDICRQAIRKHLLNVNPRKNLFVRIRTLELPWLLTRYLLYDVSLHVESCDDIDDHGDDFASSF